MLITIPGILLALVLHSSISADLPDLPLLQREELYLVIAISLFFMPGTYRIMLQVQDQVSGQSLVEPASFKIRGAATS